MFSFLTVVKPWEWVLLGALAVAGLATYVLAGKYIDARVQTGEVTQALNETKASSVLQTKISNITDQTLADVYNQSVKKQADLFTARQGALDEYLTANAFPPAPELLPVAEPVASTPKDRPHLKDVPAPKPAAKPAVGARKQTPAAVGAARERVDNPAPRLNQLAVRMQQRFCESLPDDPSCHNPQGAAGTVPG